MCQCIEQGLSTAVDTIFAAFVATSITLASNSSRVHMKNTSFLNNTLAGSIDGGHVPGFGASDHVAGGSILALAGMCNPHALFGTDDTLVRLEGVHFANNGDLPAMRAQTTSLMTSHFLPDNQDHIVHSFQYPKFCTEPPRMSDLTPEPTAALSTMSAGKFLSMDSNFIRDTKKV